MSAAPPKVNLAALRLQVPLPTQPLGRFLVSEAAMTDSPPPVVGVDFAAVLQRLGYQDAMYGKSGHFESLIVLQVDNIHAHGEMDCRNWFGATQWLGTPRLPGGAS